MIAVYVFGTLLALLLAVVVLSALADRPPRRPGAGPATARERQEAAIEALREIEFEYQTGKLTEEDYARLRDHWSREALVARDELRQALEAGDELSGALCPGCGAQAPPGARFCARCGGPLAGSRR